MANSPLPNMSSGQTVTAEIWNTQVNEINDHETRLSTAESGKVAKTTQINTASGSGLTGGGDLSANRSLAADFGTAAGKVAQGNDSRINNGQTAYTTTTATGSGNADLNTRLGSAVTTTNTVTAYLGDTSKVGTGTDGSLSTGSIGAQLNYIKANLGGGGGGGGMGSAVTVQSAPGDSGTLGANVLYGDRSTGSVVGVTFVAPPSGRVLINWSCGIKVNNTGDNYWGQMNIEVRTGGTIGSGSTTGGLAADTAIACQNTGITSENSFSNTYFLSGLVPGNTYNIKGLFSTRNTVGLTATFNRPKVVVSPLAA